MEKVLLESSGDSGFSRCREASEPDGESPLLPQFIPLMSRERRMPCNVSAIMISFFILDCGAAG